MSKPATKQALRAKAPPAESLMPAAGAAAGLAVVALAEVGVRADMAARRDFFIDSQRPTGESSKWKVQKGKVSSKKSELSGSDFHCELSTFC
jgi:hypothetical protein